MVKQELINRISRFMRTKSGDNFCHYLIGHDLSLTGEPHTWHVVYGAFDNQIDIGKPFVRLRENWGLYYGDQREREYLLEELTEETLQKIINDTSERCKL